MQSIDSYDFKGKRAIIRVDFNVPLNDKLEITDDTRIRAAIPTIKKVLQEGGSAILMSHLGRPKNGPEDKFSLRHIIPGIEARLGVKVDFADDCQGEEAAAKAAADSVAAAEQAKLLDEKIAALPDEPVFDIITTMGVIKVKLYSGTPKHRENFARLALQGYYDGILFHRVINGFMIQGGDPYTKDSSVDPAKWGTGGPAYTVPAEFVPEYKHKKGALAAARRGDTANPLKESSGSQFYLVQDEAACASLAGDYTVFGQTVEGFDVIDSIAAVETDSRNRPLQEVKIVTVKLDENQE